MPAKRPPSSDVFDTVDKRKRKYLEAKMLDKLASKADSVLQIIPQLQDDVRSFFPEILQDCFETILTWRLCCENSKKPSVVWTKQMISALDRRLPTNKTVLQTFYNPVFEEFALLMKQKLSSLPPPSDFAKTWSQHTAKFDTRLLCLRPPSARGLPLCTLHDIFREYAVTLHSPLPEGSESAIAATKSAAKLCAAMGRSFSSKDEEGIEGYPSLDSKEDARTSSFDSCVHGVLDKFKKFYQLKPRSDLHGGVVDALLMDDVFLALRVFKADIGEGGDCYMQGVRSVDLAINVLKERPNDSVLIYGAPMFLICVSGPMLLVAGVFYDGEHVVVEPLGDVCIMLEDYTNGRQEKLARVLYALNKGIGKLKEQVIQRPPRSFPPSTPRIYTSCDLYNSSGSVAQGNLVFNARLAFPNCNRLFFSASLTPGSPTEVSRVVVKLVSGRYGADVHQLLAGHHFAPTLYGCSRLEGAPVAYVMQYLSPSSWCTLFDYANVHKSSLSLNPIRIAINRAITILQDAGQVHGDLRPPNIMINLDEDGKLIFVDDGAGVQRANIRIVDYDWAGEAGKVRYPPSRNADLIWPGRAGGPIEAGHDLALVDSWWSKLGETPV